MQEHLLTLPVSTGIQGVACISFVFANDGNDYNYVTVKVFHFIYLLILK